MPPIHDTTYWCAIVSDLKMAHYASRCPEVITDILVGCRVEREITGPYRHLLSETDLFIELTGAQIMLTGAGQHNSRAG
jgi:hypothetical protein